jgi:Na+/proline symporter
MTWWATWYPGAEPGGGGFVAQRMLSAKDEKHSLYATLWFNVAHFAIRPWPWILTALAALILYPGLEDPESGYVKVMIDHLPASLRGLMLAGFIAAYMSTIGTNLNWGASYLVNDFYRRFIKIDAPEAHYVSVAQWATVLLTILSAIVTFYLTSIAGAWKVLLATGAGTGGVLMLRWYWWRINAWSEIAAMIAAAVVSVALQVGWGLDSDQPVDFAWIMIVTVAITTAVWVAVTLATKPESMDTLVEFYRRVRPSKAGWGPVAAHAPEVRADASVGGALFDWVLGCVLIYAALFGVGKLIFGEWALGAATLAAAAGAGYSLAVRSRREAGN